LRAIDEEAKGAKVVIVILAEVNVVIDKVELTAPDDEIAETTVTLPDTVSGTEVDAPDLLAELSEVVLPRMSLGEVEASVEVEDREVGIELEANMLVEEEFVTATPDEAEDAIRM
jgi:hypothetical protein